MSGCCLPFVLSVVSDRDAAEDIVSETFLALVRNLHTLSPNSCRLHGWLMQVARTRWAIGPDGGLVCGGLWRSCRNGTREGAKSIWIALLVDENRRLVMNVLSSVGDEHRVVLELKNSDELSGAAYIAARIGQTESIESLLFRVRVEFRRKYSTQLPASRFAGVTQP